MSFSSKARNNYTFASQFAIVQNNVAILYARDRMKKTPTLIAQPQFGTSPPSANNAYLALNTAGGSMIGALGFLGIRGVFVTAGNQINLSPGTGAYSSFVTLQGGVGLVISTIVGAANDGQILYLLSPGGSVTIDNTGNIWPMNGRTSYTWTTNDFITLMFDSSFAPGGKWRQIGAPMPGANTFLSNLEAPTAVNQDLMPADPNVQKLGTTFKPWTELNAANITLRNDLTNTIFERKLFDAGHYVQEVLQDNTHTNIGFYWQIVSGSGAKNYMQIVHNTGNDPVDFIYAQTPVWITHAGVPSSGLAYIQFDEMTAEPTTPPSGKIRLYSIVSGSPAVRYFIIKWDDGTKTVLASH